MNEKYYTAEEISKLLNIHVKTVQRYIREGKIRATKIGKSWRVTGHDLSIFTEEQATTQLTTENSKEMTTGKASSVIDLVVRSKEEAGRISNSLTAAMNVKPMEYGQASLQSQYIELERTLRIMLWGNISFTSGMLQMIEMLIGQQGEE